MMNEIAFIWDLDGTLIDSYPSIVKVLTDLVKHYGISGDEEYIHKFIIDKSIAEYIKDISNEYCISQAELRIFMRNSSSKYEDLTMQVDGIIEVLDFLESIGIRNYIYTHNTKDNTTRILKRLNMLDYFSDIVTCEDGFKRKPDGEGIVYLLDKYNLTTSCTYYVGDRTLDVASAKNANVKSIYYGHNAKIDADYVITDMREIIDLVKKLTC